MLLQRLRWLLPALIVSWMHLQLGAASPAHEERSSHVSANTFNPRAATLTMIRQDYNKREHPPDGKNDTQSGHKLVASPAGLLRPDKFQFYTYNDKGDMITRQMTVQEIQGLIAAGGADHVAIDRQEPQKADDVLTGGKKVMDVVQKVQNVLKSALDKPPILTGSMPKIPEHANVEWSNILPSILSGETDAISLGNESDQSSYKYTTEKAAGSSTATYMSESTSSTVTNVMSDDAKRKPAIPSSVQTNAYAGFTNNMEQVSAGEKPQYVHYSQRVPTTDIFTEKPMIPVPVITLIEQKLSTLQSTVTESPVFQMLSVIPATTTESGLDKKDEIVNAVSTEQPAQIEEIKPHGDEIEQFVELTLSKVPEVSTHPADATKQTAANFDSKISQGTEVATHSTSPPSVSTASSNINTKIVTHGEINKVTTDRISSLSTSYVFVRNKNNTKPSEDFSFGSVTKESQANGTHNDDKITSQVNTTVSGPLSHASATPRPEETSGVTASSLTFASVSRIKISTVPTSPYTDRPDLNSSTITEALLADSVMPTYTENRVNLPTEIHSSVSMEPLPTQLIDSLSNVMSQISEAKPPVLSLSSASDRLPEMPFVNINYDPKRNLSDDSAQITIASANIHHTNEENIERVVGSPTHAFITARPSSQGEIIRVSDYSTVESTTKRFTTAMVTEKESLANIGISDVSATPSAPNLKFTDTMTSDSMTSSPVWVQLEEIRNLTDTPATSEASTEITSATSEKHTTKETEEPTVEGISLKTPSTSASTDTKKPTLTNEYIDNTLANLNLSNPVSAIEQLLSIAPLLSSTQQVETISLPSDTSNLMTNDLASGLIAGTTTRAPEKSGANKVGGNQIENASSAPTISHVTQIYQEITGVNASNDQKQRNVTSTTQKPFLTKPAENSVSKLNAQTKETNATSGNKNVSTKEPSKEKFDSSTKVPLPSSSNKFVNVSEASKEEMITTSPERLSTVTANIQSPSTNKSPLVTRLPAYNQDKKGEREKTKTTEAPFVRTDVDSVLSSSTKVALTDSHRNGTANANVSAHGGGNSKIEIFGEKNESFANVSSVTQESVIHKQPGNFLAAESVNKSANKTSDSAFSQSINRINDTKNQDGNVTTPIPPHAAPNNRTAVTPRIPTQSNKDDYKINSSSILENASTDNPVIKIVTQESTDDASASSVTKPLRPSQVNGTNYSNFTNNNDADQNNKNIPSISESSSMKNALTDEQSNNTENKPASLKNSEDSSKPDVTRLQLSTVPSNVPTRQPVASKPTISQKLSEKSDFAQIDADVNSEDKWTLISQQGSPTKLPKPPKPSKPPRKPVNHSQTSNSDENNSVRFPGASATQQQDDLLQEGLQSVLPLDASQSASGLDVTVKHTSVDILSFAKLCNELAFNFWVATNKGLSTARSLALSPFGMTSLLAMIFLGARGPTSDQMNEVLGLDDVATFNPHLVFQNITDTVSLARGQGIANAAFVRELFADKMKVRKLMPFYKEQAQQFYEGLVAEVNFATISDLVRRRTNLLVRKQTGGRIKDFVKTNTVPLRSPLAALSANVFQTDCNTTLTSSVGRDGELYFAVSPAVRQRRLVPVPATTWRSGVLAGYEPSIDATAVALGGSDRLVSTIFILPGQQGHTAPGDTLDRLEQRLVRSAFRDGTWNKLLKVLTPRSGLELQVPKFSHRSVINATAALKRMGLDELFSGNADFKGINGVGHRLYLADVLQMNLFSTCGDENILSGRHHVETYPASPLRNIRWRAENTGGLADDVAEDDGASRNGHASSFYADRFSREKRQLPSTERPRLKLDRPFLYFVRHNPSGIILHMGRFNPRLLP